MTDQPKELKGKGLKAVGFRVIVKPIEVDEAVDTGAVKIYKPQQTIDAEKGGVDRGKVIDVGPDAFSEARSVWAKPGDYVVWARYAGRPMKDEILGDVHVLNDLDILARYEETSNG